MTGQPTTLGADAATRLRSPAPVPPQFQPGHRLVLHSPEIRQRAEAMLRDEASVREVARTLGVPKSTIAKWRKRLFEPDPRARELHYLVDDLLDLPDLEGWVKVLVLRQAFQVILAAFPKN